MTAVRDDWVIEKGAIFSRAFQYLDPDTEEPIDLTGYVARLTIRAPNVDGAIVAEYLSSASGSPLTVDGAEGTLDFAADVVDSLDAPADGCMGWYTLKAWPDGQESQAIRFAEGVVRWSPESTRSDT